MRRANLVVSELGALLELLVDDTVRELGDGNECFLELVVVRERILSRLLITRDHAPHDVGVILGKLLAHVEDAPGISFAVAIEQPRAVVDFVLRHHRVEPRPGVDVAADQEVTAVGVLLNEHRRYIFVGEPGREQRPHREDVRIGAAHHSHFLALEIGNLTDAAVLGGDEGGPFRPRIDVYRLDRIAVDPGDERGGAGGRTEIDGASVEKLQRIRRTVGLHPHDLDAVLGEFLLQVAFVLEQHRDRIVGRPVDVDLLGIVGGAHPRGRNEAERQHCGKQ